MKIKYLTYECSSKCNMDCGFCFSGWRDQSSELNTEQAKECIDILVGKGLEAINFTGGEPLLRKDIAELLSYSKQKSLATILSTNGILLKEKLPEIAEYLDFIGLPIDSSDPKVHNYMRATGCVSNHHQHALDLIDWINKEYPRIGVKINTVVAKANKDSVIGLGDLIKDKTIAWKFSHFIPFAYGEKHKEEFEISKEECNDLVAMCKKRYPGMNIIYSEAHARDDGCRILSVEGHILMPTPDELKDLGYLPNLSSEELTNGFNTKKNQYFLKKTYPGIKVD